MSRSNSFRVAVVETADILPLRLKVLREGTPSKDPGYAEDDLDITRHIALFDSDEIIATSTWLTRDFPQISPVIPGVQLRGVQLRGVQLRGMAVDHHLQGCGIGSQLLNHGVAYAKSLGAGLVWARARDSALHFYEQNDFRVVGDAFDDEATGMSHHLVVRFIGE